jgi:stage III sporulation protein AE
MMIFTGLISIQSIVGTSADNLAVKTGKYMVSNFVPVVGSAVSDAYTTLKSSMILLRSGTGSFGIIAILITILPAAVYSALYYLSVKSAFIISDMFGEKSLSKLYMNISSVLSVVFSVTVCFAVIMIISTAVVMMVGMGSV